MSLGRSRGLLNDGFSVARRHEVHLAIEDTSNLVGANFSPPKNAKACPGYIQTIAENADRLRRAVPVPNRYPVEHGRDNQQAADDRK